MILLDFALDTNNNSQEEKHNSAIGCYGKSQQSMSFIFSGIFWLVAGLLLYDRRGQTTRRLYWWCVCGTVDPVVTDSCVLLEEQYVS